MAKRVSDGSVLRLLKAWLRAPSVEEDGETGHRKVLPNRGGTPQGGVIWLPAVGLLAPRCCASLLRCAASPLLANLYLNDLDHAVNEQCEQKPTMVRYADDLLILCKPGQGAGLPTRLQRWLEARKLKLNEEKTRLVDTRTEGIEFLGFSVAWRQGLKSKRWYPHVEPSAKSQAKLRDKVRAVLEVRTRNQAAVAVLRKVNQITRGWAGAFHYGHSTHGFGQQQLFVRNRLRRWLWRKYSRTHGPFELFTDDRLTGQCKLWSWPLTAAWKR